MPYDEQPLRPLDQTEESLVRALAHVMMALPRLVDADMVGDGGLPLSEYTPLMFLSEAPHRRMRMSELATVCNLLEKQGFVQRAKCQEDLRGWNAVLTDDGFARLQEAWPAHLASIRRHVLDNLAGHDLAALTAALERVATTP
jgi:hypothetical protein